VLTAVDGFYICNECKADVWVLTGFVSLDEVGPGDLTAVVFGNRKFIANNDSYKEHFEDQCRVADNFWAEQNDGPMPSEALFGFLNATHKGQGGIGHTVSIERARELVKASGGLSMFN